MLNVESLISRIIWTINFFLILVGVCLFWIIFNWPYTPSDAIEDGAKMGSWAILIDFTVLMVLYHIWFKKRVVEE